MMLTKEVRGELRRQHSGYPVDNDAVLIEILDHCDEMDAALEAEKKLGDELAGWLRKRTTSYPRMDHDVENALARYRAARGKKP